MLKLYYCLDGDDMKKEYIPNILTLTRIIFTPIIIMLGLLDKTTIVIILAAICALTDMFDGKLARKWNLVSKKGAKLDTIADKIFGIGLIISLIRNQKLLIFVLIFEIIIAATNLYYYYKNKKIESLMIGKIKTVFLFSGIIFCMMNKYFKIAGNISNGFIYATINLQILCSISYLINFIKNKNPITVEDNKTHQEIMDIEKTMKIENLEQLTEKYEENTN